MFPPPSSLFDLIDALFYGGVCSYIQYVLVYNMCVCNNNNNNNSYEQACFNVIVFFYIVFSLPYSCVRCVKLFAQFSYARVILDVNTILSFTNKKQHKLLLYLQHLNFLKQIL
eukprot:TRINITY_DN23871_c0_g1_i1.p9 TRINITY_DN23871_c0_g1~~TRINITY_DN23871_c0_g1_i1.p9  ORF type:complete len:113 (-),score=1.16 TRINITY_DN23871_c0_g1_i1:71-409(-)